MHYKIAVVAATVLVFFGCGAAEEDSSDLNGRRGTGHHQIEDWNGWEAGYLLRGQQGKIQNKAWTFSGSKSTKWIVLGPYKDLPRAKSGRVFASVEISANAERWIPAMPGVLCIGDPNPCDRWEPTNAEVYIDFVTDMGKRVVDSKVLKFKGALKKKRITFNRLDFNGPLKDAEIRVGKFKVRGRGVGSVSVHKTELDYSWK